MRAEIDDWLQDLEMFFPGEPYEGHRLNVYHAMQAAIIKWQYHELHAMNPGKSKKIKQELADRYHISFSLVEHYIYEI